MKLCYKHVLARYGVRTLELIPNLYNRSPSTIVLVKVEEVLQYFENNPQLDCVPALPAKCRVNRMKYGCHTLCSYDHTARSSSRYLASQDITQVLLASALHHPRFCVNQPLSSVTNYAPVAQWQFTLEEKMPCSSNLLAAGVLMKCFTTCMSSPAPSCQDCPNLCWLVAIPSF